MKLSAFINKFSVKVGSLRESERGIIATQLDSNKGNIKRTAKALGVSRQTLYNKLRDYGVQLPGGKND